MFISTIPFATNSSPNAPQIIHEAITLIKLLLRLYEYIWKGRVKSLQLSVQTRIIQMRPESGNWVGLAHNEMASCLDSPLFLVDGSSLLVCRMTSYIQPSVPPKFDCSMMETPSEPLRSASSCVGCRRSLPDRVGCSMWLLLVQIPLTYSLLYLTFPTLW